LKARVILFKHIPDKFKPIVKMYNGKRLSEKTPLIYKYCHIQYKTPLFGGDTPLVPERTILVIFICMAIMAAAFSLSFSIHQEETAEYGGEALQYDGDANELARCEEVENQLYETLVGMRESKPGFMQIAKEVASEREYDGENYNCRHFTEELVERLRGAGYEAEYEKVRIDCESNLFQEEACKRTMGSHAVTKLVVYIESTSGNLVEPSEYGDYGGLGRGRGRE
jgi:hypothetical protein